MNCLHCNKLLSLEEKHYGWHKKCIKKFFNTSKLPNILLDKSELNSYLSSNINKGYTVTGVQKKMSLNLDVEQSKLTLVNYPTGYILKPNVDEYKCLPQAEYLIMHLANISNLSTVPHALIKINNEYAYITKRIDRKFNNKQITKYAMEDFCQLDLRLTQDKYLGSYERCAKIIEKYSSQSKLDIVEMYMRVVFSFIIGNSDMHLKNFSLIEDIEQSNKYYLSPAYDLLPVNIILKEDIEQTALTINGKKRNLKRKDFEVLGFKCGLELNTINKIINKFTKLRNKYESIIQQYSLDNDMKKDLINLINERLDILN